MKFISLHQKNKRLNVVDLKKNNPEQFGLFIMALKNLQESDDWSRICGIHGDTFKPNDPCVLCPTDPNIVSILSETGEPFYCKHSVYSFSAWHTPYLYQFELLLNKYNKSSNKNYITLPYLDLTDFGADFSFLNDLKIVISYNDKKIIVDNPLAGSYYYVDGVKTRTTRNGFFTPRTKNEYEQLLTIKKQLNNTLYASSYEHFSSSVNLLTDYIPLEVPHNNLHDIIGGNGGNMSDITISAFDPVFWLHHCNMDRHLYTWLYLNTDHFKKSIYPTKILDINYESTQAPFFNSNIYSTDFNNYNYGWMNNQNRFMLLKDILHFENFPYTYKIIKPTPEKPNKSYYALVNIPVPRESISILLYLYKKSEILNKENHYAGFASWFGINRNEKYCSRCEIVRTNIKIDIDDYVLKNNITNDNIDDYELLIVGQGKLINKLGAYNVYSLDELVSNGNLIRNI
jgi:hypothetical protein